MEDYILALDQGTTSSRAIVLDHEGGIVASAQQEFAQSYPQPGWVEHDPMEIWETQASTVVSAMCKAGVLGDSIAAIGLTNQRETTVVWDRKSGAPIYPAIVWQDRRTAELCDKLKKSRTEKLFAKKTGLRLDPYFSGTKVRWILDNVKGARPRAENGELAFGTIDSWLIWKLTGGRVHATDVTNASRTLMYDIHTGDWDDKLLEILKVPRAMLPVVKSCSEVFGKVDGASIAALGGRPIAGVAGDQQAAMFGQACFEPGMAKNTYGTGCFLLMNTGEKAVTSKNNLLTTVAWRLGEKTEYALEGSVFMGGAVVQWLRDEMGIISSARECDELAESVGDAGGLYIVPAFTGLGAPHWDPYARGAAFGMTRGTGRAQFARAAVEAIAYQSADLIACMERDSGIPLRELRVDGGAARSAPLLQFQADLLGVPVVRPKIVETTALGAAYLAGLAVGYWTSKEDIARHWKLDATWKPAMRKSEVLQRRKGWQRAVERSFRWEDGQAWKGEY